MFPPEYWSTSKKLMLLGTMAGGKLVEATATGNPLTFLTEKAKPLKSLLIPLLPRQSGTGDPSPQNIRNILPWNGLAVFGGGKNLLNPSVENSIPFQNANYNKYTLTDGVVVTSGNTIFGFKVKVKPNTTYRFTFDTSESITMEIFSYTTEPSVIQNDDRQIINIANNTWKFTTFADTEWISCGIYTSKVGVTVRDFRLTAGSAQEPYEPYVPITETDISFPSPVYGGTIDLVTGELWGTWAFANLNSESAWGSYGTGDGFLVYVTKSDMQVGNRLPGYCDMFPSAYSATGANIRFGADDNVIRLYNINTLGIADLSEWKEFIGTDGINVCYLLATPVLLATLTPQQITALVGTNTIWSDTNGENTVVFLKKA